MPLDSQAQAILDEIQALGLPKRYMQTVSEARESVIAKLVTGESSEPVHRVTDQVIPGPGGCLGLRIYSPGGKEPLPVVIYFHGGGWAICNLDTHDSICRSLANQVNCLVVAVDYRLAPEHKYPAGLEDAYLATQWVANNAARLGGDPNRIAVAGDSAGGNFSAVVSLLARDRGGPRLAYQVLVYPVTDYYLPGTPSYEEVGNGYTLDRDSMIWFWNHYLSSHQDLSDPYLNPLRALDLSGLPPALVQTSEFDPLRDEGELFAQRLKEAGVPVTLTRYTGMMHGYLFDRDRLDKGRLAMEEVVRELRAAFTPR